MESDEREVPVLDVPFTIGTDDNGVRHVVRPADAAERALRERQEALVERQEAAIARLLSLAERQALLAERQDQRLATLDSVLAAQQLAVPTETLSEEPLGGTV